MPHPFRTLPRALRFYALLLLPPLAWFAWGSLGGLRLLGDDNESTETLAAPGSRTGRGTSGYHSSFYHK